MNIKIKKWIPLAGKIFHARKINDELNFNVETDLQTELFKSKEQKLLRVYFLSSGEQTPFRMRLNLNEQPRPYYELEGQFNGKLKLERVNELDL